MITQITTSPIARCRRDIEIAGRLCTLYERRGGIAGRQGYARWEAVRQALLADLDKLVRRHSGEHGKTSAVLQ